MASNPQDQIFVFFPSGRNIGVGEVRKYVTTDLGETSDSHACVAHSPLYI